MCFCGLRGPRGSVEWRLDGGDLRMCDVTGGASDTTQRVSEIIHKHSVTGLVCPFNPYTTDYGLRWLCWPSRPFYTVWVKNPPSRLVAIFPKRLWIFQPNFTPLLCVPIYARVRIFTPRALRS